MTPLQKPARDASLDVARALAVVAMVVGHTLDALLSSETRAIGAVQAYWRYRGLTAPLFLLVSGWAVMTALQRAPERGSQVMHARLPRVVLLFALGYLLRLPVWDISGLAHFAPDVWSHFLAFDALHCLGTSLFGLAALVALDPSPRVRALSLGALAVGLPAVSGLVWNALSDAPLVVRQSVGGGDAPFPLLPWAGYFFVGALLGTVRRDGLGPVRQGALFVASGLVLGGCAYLLGMENLPITSPNLFAWRLGHLFVILGLVSLVPAGWAKHLGAVGRASLGVYVLHLPIVYGWGTFPGLVREIGPVLAFDEALTIGLVLLAACLLVTHLAQRARKWSARQVLQLRSAA